MKPGENADSKQSAKPAASATPNLRRSPRKHDETPSLQGSAPNETAATPNTISPMGISEMLNSEDLMATFEDADDQAMEAPAAAQTAELERLKVNTLCSYFWMFNWISNMLCLGVLLLERAEKENPRT